MSEPLTLTSGEINRAYDALVPRLKRPRKEEWRGPCPIHQGERDSFAVKPDTGAWFCHSTCGHGGSIFDLVMELRGVDFKAAKDEIFHIIGRPETNGNGKPSGAFDKTYDYVDEGGKLLFQAVRKKNPKSFTQRRPDGKEWVWNIKGVRLVLYRLPLLLKRAAEAVFVVEGERDVHSLEDLGLLATTNPMGAGKWRPEYSETLRGRSTALLPDNDTAGRKHMADVAADLLRVGCKVRLVELPGLPEKGGDVTDWVAAGGTEMGLLALAGQAAPLDAAALSELQARWGIERTSQPSGDRQAPAQAHAEAPVPESNGEPAAAAMPQIKVNGRELRELSAEVLLALTAANQPPKLFSRAGSLVRVDLAKDGGPVITNVTDTHLRGEMTRAANFFKLVKTEDGGFVRTAVSPPLDAAKDLLSRPSQELGMPELESVSEAPFIGPNGAVIDRPGYDPATRTFYAPSGNLDGFDVPDRPTVDDVDGARALIEEAFIDFPFTSSASRANALALFITPELRPAIRGNVPLALLDAPQAGTGKTLIAEVVAMKSTGAKACMKPAPKRDPEEWRKILTATIRGGQSLAVFDNVDGVLESPYLAAALTSETWQDRILGESAQVTLPVRTVFMATGNNLILGGDIPRRCYWARLDAESAEPWRKRVFRHSNLKDWIQVNRGRLLGGVLTLARAWFVAGQPAAPTPVLGSFEEWCRIVGGILHYAGIEGFLGNLDELYRNSDPTQAAWEALLSELLAQMPSEGFTIADVVARFRDSQSALRGVLPEDLGDLDPLPSFQRRLGKAFAKRSNRRYGDRALHLFRIEGLRHGAVVWTVKGRAA